MKSIKVRAEHGGQGGRAGRVGGREEGGMEDREIGQSGNRTRNNRLQDEGYNDCARTAHLKQTFLLWSQ